MLPHFLPLSSNETSVVCSGGCVRTLCFPSLSYIRLQTSDIDKLSVYCEEAADCYLTEIKIQNGFSQEKSVKHLRYIRVFPLNRLKWLALALKRHMKPRTALTFYLKQCFLTSFLLHLQERMKATIWSATVPSHAPQHRTEKRTQNTNWKTVHMLDSTIWWKAEYS